MRSFLRCSFIFLVGAVLFFDASRVFAVDDGFRYDKKIEGKYVIAYFAPGLEAGNLAQQLDIRPSDQVLAGQSLRLRGSSEAELVQMLDTLFLQVSDILDMHLYSLKMDINISPTHAALGEIYENLFHKSLGGRRSFYVYDYNSVYVSADFFQKNILSHEMAHAIISRFFPVPAPIKVQEVLAMYVEYNLRRSDSGAR